LSKHRCLKCVNEEQTPSKEDFIKKAIKVHGNRYGYSLVDYINNNTEVKIICPEHGIFKQTPHNHTIRKTRCHKCYLEDQRKEMEEKFIKESEEINGDRYDYSQVNYKIANKKVKIICKEHGIFEQTPAHHLYRMRGCPTCQESNGERIVRKYLIKNKIKYQQEKRFPECKYKYTLPFDFYLPEYNMCVEYDGRHHFIPISAWGGEPYLENVKIRDKIKNNFCKNNNIKLLRIKYNENVNEKLKTFFNI